MGRPKSFVKSEVLAEATKVFWRKGLAETTVQDLEIATGINKSSLYAEFAGKDDLFVACLRHYVATNGVYELLRREPLGWSNVGAMLSASQAGPGPKGCFAVNCLREAAILPTRARAALDAHLARVRAALAENLRAAGEAQEAESKAELILTFNAGLALELNLRQDRAALRAKTERFLALLRAK